MTDRCICTHAPEQHGAGGCYVVSIATGRCTCDWNGKRDADVPEDVAIPESAGRLVVSLRAAADAFRSQQQGHPYAGLCRDAADKLEAQARELAAKDDALRLEVAQLAALANALTVVAAGQWLPSATATVVSDALTSLDPAARALLDELQRGRELAEAVRAFRADGSASCRKTIDGMFAALARLDATETKETP